MDAPGPRECLSRRQIDPRDRGHPTGEFSKGYNVFAGRGNGGQHLYILQEEGIVVTIFAGAYNLPSIHSEHILHRIMAASEEIE